ncbi:transposable element Tcb1 transposase [Trichonephila clavipes]|nr:transposable element Tcb1 transposase [Trichonephila clavipes]
MSRRKQRSAFDQVPEFDKERIVAYRDCGLSFRKIGSCVGRNQTTVIRKCDRWMQKVTPLSATPRWSYSSLERPWKEDAEQLRYEPPAPGIMVWDGIGYHSRTPLVLIASTLNSQLYFSEVLEPAVLPYLQGFATAIFQQDNARPRFAKIVQMFFVNHQIELLPWSACSPDLSPIENMWSMVAQRLTMITPPAATPDQLWQRVEATCSTSTPRTHPKSL